MHRALYNYNYNYLKFLTGISQRDYTQYYDHISKQHEEICRSIQEFFKKHIQYKFLDEDCKYLEGICGCASLSSMLLLSQGLVVFSLGESESSCGYSMLSSKSLELHWQQKTPEGIGWSSPRKHKK